MDTIGPLPVTKKGHKHVLIITCAFTRFTCAFPLKTLEAIEIATVFYDRFICMFGVPNAVLTDNGSPFISRVFAHLCKILSVDTLKTASHHQATNGASERFNYFLEVTLRYYIDRKQDNWE